MFSFYHINSSKVSDNNFIKVETDAVEMQKLAHSTVEKNGINPNAFWGRLDSSYWSWGRSLYSCQPSRRYR